MEKKKKKFAFAFFNNLKISFFGFVKTISAVNLMSLSIIYYFSIRKIKKKNVYMLSTQKYLFFYVKDNKDVLAHSFQAIKG